MEVVVPIVLLEPQRARTNYLVPAFGKVCHHVPFLVLVQFIGLDENARQVKVAVHQPVTMRVGHSS